MFVDVDWIYLAHDGMQWWNLVDTNMKLQVPKEWGILI
jgi:hypothetical protein